MTMSLSEDNRFADLFKEGNYLTLKNHLYNYLLRKKAIKKCLQQESPTLILEVGSGISPVVTDFKHTIYSDLSFEALKILKNRQGKGYYVVADGMQLPFKSNLFSHIICSEVLEHLENDLQAIKEMARTLEKSTGFLIITVPHRKCYFANDDYFVKHYRRYELFEIKNKLKVSGLNPLQVKKVLGPLEKATMSFVVFLITIIQRQNPGQYRADANRSYQLMTSLAFFFEWINLFFKGFVWLDALVMPRSLSSVILIKSVVNE